VTELVAVAALHLRHVAWLRAIGSAMTLLTTVTAATATAAGRAVLGEVSHYNALVPYDTAVQKGLRPTLVALPALNTFGGAWLRALLADMAAFAAVLAREAVNTGHGAYDSVSRQ
jgi:hypothetical protein